MLAGLLLAAVTSAGVSAQPVSAPLPPPRPDRRAPPEPAAKPAPAETGPAPAAAAAADAAACGDRLARLGVRFEERPAIRENACSVDDPVLVSGLPDGLEVKPPALMTCPLAEALARWTLDTLTAEADRLLQTAATGLLIGTSYECRQQRSGAKLSEHAFGNGVDVMGFEFEKRSPIAVGSHPEGSPEAEFQAAVHKGACAVFTTVLGPGSDAAHGDHLHLDMRGRRGGYRICQ
ncbi:MAG TPA: extensin family protein [Microvirga sp.]|nr:extensin family protein [Microvirga sp.]